MGKNTGHLVVTDDPNDDVAIRVDDVSKSFRLPHNKQNSLKGSLINIIARGDRTFETQEVLKSISFEIKKGEFFGIVGRNGSGKSTLLKLLAGIYTPSKGKIIVNGSLTPFIELGVGFNPELTGRENVYLNGALLGFNDKEVDAMYDNIVAFAELERFMDQKLKNYSSGMQVRLAFSIAIRAKSDMLVLDEVLAVGDAAFQQKCYDYFNALKSNKQTVILVTHDMAAVKQFCSKAMLIDKGLIKLIGDPSEVANLYTIDNVQVANGSKQRDNTQTPSELLQYIGVELSKPAYSQSEDLRFNIEYELRKKKDIDFGISILSKGLSIVENNTTQLKIDSTPSKKHKISYRLPLGQLNPGVYRVDIALFNKPAFTLAAFVNDAATFVIEQTDEPKGGLLSEQGEWL